MESPSCLRWPENLRLRRQDGKLVAGRCKSPNRCPKCAKLGALENSELLQLDAMHGEAPSIAVCLTRRTALWDASRLYRSTAKVLKALKRRWPDVQYARNVEFTSGYAQHSGGKRRPHFHLLLKGIPQEDVDAAAQIIRRVWCAREDAEPQAQSVEALRTPKAMLRYVTQHFQKESQRPPDGWKGHRLTMSRGYLWVKTPEGRAAAQRRLRVGREIWRLEGQGIDGALAYELAEQAVTADAALSWRLVKLTRRGEWPEFEPGTSRAAERRGARGAGEWCRTRRTRSNVGTNGPATVRKPAICRRN